MKLSRFLPLGIDKKPVIRWLWGGALLGLVFQIFFHNNYFYAKQALYDWKNPQQLLPGAVMAPFASLLGYSLYGCVIGMLFMIPLAVYFWSFHYQGSKGIYTMRRLPRRRELFLRCFTVPALGALLYALELLVLLLLNFAIYWLCTPEQCLPPFSWAALFGG